MICLEPCSACSLLSVLSRQSPGCLDKQYRLLIFICFIIFLPVSCSDKADFQELTGKNMIVPDCCLQITDYTFIHIVRNQDCTVCSVSSLYQWNSVIDMIDRSDISYCFIVEMRPEDTSDTITEALRKHPFFKPIFIDYDCKFLEDNKWLKRRKYKELNDFVIDKKGTIITTGDPMTDFHFLHQLRNM